MKCLVLNEPMGNSETSCKGFFMCKNRINTIVLNSDMPYEIQRIVLAHEPLYKKGDYNSTVRIAANYPNAIVNAAKILKNLESLGIRSLEDTDEHNQWLYKNCLTFSTVHEAIKFLESLKK